MTAIAKRKTICRAETSALVRKRPLMIELRPHTVFIREKGRRAGYEVSWESVYLLGAAKAAEQRREARKHRGRH
jgi:hypothetical protein